MKKETSWYDEFVSRNKDPLRKILSVFHPNSYFGLGVLLTVMHIMLFIFLVFFKRGFATNLLYIGTLYLFMVLVFNIPDHIREAFFCELPESIIDELNKETLHKFLNILHHTIMISNDFYESLFIHYDTLTVAGVLTSIFGFFLLVRNMPLFVIFHLSITLLILTCIGSTYVLLYSGKKSHFK